MTFQFLCPQGHLLEGEESQMGQQCDCPMCGMRFIIPTIAGAAPTANPYDAGGYQAGGYDAGGYDAGGFSPVGAGGFDMPEPTAGPIDPFAAAAATDAASPLESDAARLVHIPCPAGHELETPYDMLGQDVLCPYCGVQFNLRYKDSVEYKAERTAEQERKEQKAGKLWFQWAIIAAIVVLGSLIGMVIYTIQSSGG